jgi:hypothetical protein
MRWQVLSCCCSVWRSSIRSAGALIAIPASAAIAVVVDEIRRVRLQQYTMVPSAIADGTQPVTLADSATGQPAHEAHAGVR